MSPRTPRFPNRPTRMTLATVATVLAGLVATGCDSLLEVELPGQVQSDDLNDPALAQTMVTSTVADFECALSNYAGATAALTDELIGSTGWADYTRWDQRGITAEDGNHAKGTCTNFGFGLYTPLQTARFQAEDNFERIQAFDDGAVSGKESMLATLRAYAGYSYVLLGEGMCRATVDEGPELSRTEIMERAVDRFGDAISRAQQAGATDILNMARVGLARAHQNLGNLGQAETVAADVPQGFVRYATRSGDSERRWNRIARHTHADFFYSVAPEFRDLTFNGDPDPRVQTTDAGRLGHDGVTPVFLPDKYSDVSDDIAIASWEEAQLIIAEARGGQDAVDIINALHAQAGLDDFQSNDEQEIQAHIVEERRRIFYLDGHRLGDMLRYDLAFPSGETHKGQPYGDTECLPLPNAEIDNNPNVSG